MRKRAPFTALIALLLLGTSAFASDQDKAQKEINKITAMTTDFDGRRVVNLTMSEKFDVPRLALVKQRTQTGLNYGGLFLAQELIQKGSNKNDLAARLKSGSAIADIANQQHVDWKQVAQDAKKLNGEIDKNLYSFFLGRKVTVARDAADEYDVHYDGVKADAEISQPEIASAQDRYVMWRDRAATDRRKDHTLGAGDERVAYSDHVANGGPGGTSAPAILTGQQH